MLVPLSVIECSGTFGFLSFFKQIFISAETEAEQAHDGRHGNTRKECWKKSPDESCPVSNDDQTDWLHSIEIKQRIYQRSPLLGRSVNAMGVAIDRQIYDAALVCSASSVLGTVKTLIHR